MFAKNVPKVSINDRFYKVSSKGILHVAKRCFTNGFLGLLGSTCDPLRALLGPRSADGFVILGPRSDEIGNPGIIALLFFVRTKKKGLTYRLLMMNNQ